jgi:TctA family transporter
MEVFDNLILGAQVAFSWQNVLYCLIGVLLGTLIGVLPGIGGRKPIYRMPVEVPTQAGDRSG